MAFRLLITGANGFLGRGLIEAARTCNISVTAIILPGTDASGMDGIDVQPIEIIDSPEFRSLLNGQDAVIHLAGNMSGSRSQRYIAANVETVRELVDALREVNRPPRLIHVSSVAVPGPMADAQNGSLKRPPDEDSSCHPVSLYGRTKLAGESLALSGLPDLPVTVVRLPSAYGPGDSCFFDLFRMAKFGIFPKLCTRKKRFNLVFRDDFAAMMLAILEGPRISGVLNVGDPAIHTDEDLAQALGKAAGKTLRQVFLPRGVVAILGRVARAWEAVTGRPMLMSPGKVEEMSHSDWLQSFNRFQKLFPGIILTPLETGIAHTWRWYHDHDWL
ncbi:MAG: NAD-dependent epimerase/dehydratase family protein [Candidatus Riflebacteria bacterium]|nr:NAD-dependent epimerase/dehydratase family protein [Candidatus Riflebacteria bacterium]